jgi:hypothetical protein
MISDQQKTETNKKLLLVFAIVLVLLTIFMMYCAEPFYPGYDYHFHLRRFNALIDALREGTFPSYIDYTAAQGYGYLSKVFYPDILLLPFAGLAIVTNVMFAYKSIMFIITILCAIFTYNAVNRIYKNQFAAIISSLLYTFSVYRIFDFYHRAAVGEAIAMTFIPIVFLGLYYIIKGDYKHKWYIITIGYVLIIFSHAITSLLMFVTTLIILTFYIKPLIKEPKRILYLVIAGIVTVIITICYIAPMLEQISAIDFYYKVRPIILPHTRKLSFEFIGWSLVSGLIYPKNVAFCGVGILLTISILLRFFIKKQGKNPYLRSIDIGVLIGIGYILATSTYFPWGRFPFTLLQSIQFPWRLFGFSTFFFAIAGGYYLSLILKSNTSKTIGLAIVILLSGITVYNHLENYKYLQSNFINRINDIPTADTYFHLIGAEYMPAKVPNGAFIAQRGDSIGYGNTDTHISNFERNRNIISLNVNISKADSLELPLAYYIGYKAVLNNNILETKESNHGLVQIPVNESGRVEIYYKGTTTQTVSWYITIISILILSLYIFFSSKRRKGR